MNENCKSCGNWVLNISHRGLNWKCMKNEDLMIYSSSRGTGMPRTRAEGVCGTGWDSKDVEIAGGWKLVIRLCIVWSGRYDNGHESWGKVGGDGQTNDNEWSGLLRWGGIWTSLIGEMGVKVGRSEGLGWMISSWAYSSKDGCKDEFLSWRRSGWANEL